jgi:ferredoxin
LTIPTTLVKRDGLIPACAESGGREVNALSYNITEECTACGTCQGECPAEAISEGSIFVIDAKLCTDCGACAAVCPVEAIIHEE